MADEDAVGGEPGVTGKAGSRECHGLQHHLKKLRAPQHICVSLAGSDDVDHATGQTRSELRTSSRLSPAPRFLYSFSLSEP